MPGQISVSTGLTVSAMRAMLKEGKVSFPHTIKLAEERADSVETKLLTSTGAIVIIMLLWGSEVGKSRVPAYEYNLSAIGVLLVLGLFIGWYYYLLQKVAEGRKKAWRDFETACSALNQDPFEFLSLEKKEQETLVHGLLKLAGSDVRRARNVYTAADLKSVIDLQTAQYHMDRMYQLFLDGGLIKKGGSEFFVPLATPVRPDTLIV